MGGPAGVMGRAPRRQPEPEGPAGRTPTGSRALGLPAAVFGFDGAELLNETVYYDHLTAVRQLTAPGPDAS